MFTPAIEMYFNMLDQLFLVFVSFSAAAAAGYLSVLFCLDISLPLWCWTMLFLLILNLFWLFLWIHWRKCLDTILHNIVFLLLFFC